MLEEVDKNNRPSSSTPYDDFEDYLERLKDMYLNTLTAFNSYESLVKLISDSDIVSSEESNKNFETFNQFKNIFNPIFRALRNDMLMQLCKFFDGNKRSLSLEKIINLIKDKPNRDSINAVIQKKLHKEQNNTDAFTLVGNHGGITEENLNEIDKLYKESCQIYEEQNIKELRDKRLAHEDVEKANLNKISMIESRRIVELIGEIYKVLLNAKESAGFWDKYLSSHTRDELRYIFKSLSNYSQLTSEIRRLRHQLNFPDSAEKHYQFPLLAQLLFKGYIQE